MFAILKWAFLILLMISLISCIENREFYKFIKNSVENQQYYEKYLNEAKFSTKIYWSNKKIFERDTFYMNRFYNCICNKNFSYYGGLSGFDPGFDSHKDTLYFITIECNSKIDCNGYKFDYPTRYLQAEWKLTNGVWEYLGLDLKGPGE